MNGLTSRRIPGTPHGAVAPIEMASKSLRNVMLPPAVNGDPEKVCRDVLAPLFAIPKSAVLICSEPDALRFAQLTLGLGTFVRDDTDLILLIVFGQDAAESSATEMLRRTWTAALASEAAARRLSLYKLFAERKRLRILFRSITQRGESDPLRARLAETPAFVLVSDSEETQIELMWRTLLTFDERADVSMDIRWSFGDPQRRVRQLSAAVDRIVLEQSADPNAEATLNELIAALPLPPLPWEESFDLQTDPGVRLFSRQRAAVIRF
jgi:hypothetical protein